MEPMPDPVALQARMKLFMTQQRAEAIKLRQEGERAKANGLKMGDRWVGRNAEANRQREIYDARARAADLDARAQRCEERASAAERGFLLWRKEDQNDYVGNLDARGLYSMARRAGIALYETPLGGDMLGTPDIDSVVRGSL